MNRRVFALGSASLASVSASQNVMAQATPVAAREPTAVALIRRYVEDVLDDGKSALLFDILHPDISDVEGLYWEYVEAYAAEQTSLERSSYRLKMVFGNDDEGIGYFMYSEKPKDGELAWYGHCVVVRVQDGLISHLEQFGAYEEEE